MMTFSDIRRIHHHKPDLSLSEFIMIVDPPEDKEMRRVMADYFPTIKFMDPSGEITGYLALRLHPIKDSFDFRCLFYDTESNLCSIHQVKPMVCRIYPLWPKDIIEKSDYRLQHFISKPDPLKVVWKGGRCPTPWKSLCKEEIDAFLNSFTRFFKELEEYQEEASQWNAQFHGKNLEDLYSFILKPKRAFNKE